MHNYTRTSITPDSPSVADWEVGEVSVFFKAGTFKNRKNKVFCEIDR